MIDFIAYTSPMRISKADPYNLIVKDNPLYPGVIFVPLIFFMLYKLVERLGRSTDLDQEFFGMLAAVIIPFVGVGVMNVFTRFHFNIGERRLYWRRVGLFGFKCGTVNFSDIKKAVLESTSGGFRYHATIRLALVTTDGTIPMTRYDSGTSFKADCESAAKLIHAALGKDHGKFIEDSILELVSAGKKLQAVRLAKEHYGFGLTEAKKFIDELKP